MIEQETGLPATTTEITTSQAVRKVAINTLNPFVAQVATKVLMLGYLIAQYRLAGGPQSNLGDYFLAGNIFLYTSTIADWGLSTLLTREVARERGVHEGDGTLAVRVAMLFRQTLTLRFLISLALFLPVGIFIAVYLALPALSVQGAWTIAIITLSLLPGAFSGSVTAVLFAYERMSLPAAVSVATSAVNVALGIGALLLGWGITGLALAALSATIITAAIFWAILRRTLPVLKPATQYGASSRDRQQSLAAHLRAGWPLMLNALLVGLFFRVDVPIVKATLGDFPVQQYNAAYSFLGFVLLITPAVTLALFPRMARHAQNDRPRLAREYNFALKVLLMVSGPIIALTIWFAPLLITIVTSGKAGFQPASSTVLQILILFLPFSFINGVTQYVLIALDRQTLITRAFIVTVIFNVGANLVMVPAFGINGAGIVTILSELVLMGPFLVWTAREVGPVPVAALAARPLAAGVVTAAAGWLLWPLARDWSSSWGGLALYLACGLALLLIYGGVLMALRPLSAAEWNALRGALKRGEE